MPKRAAKSQRCWIIAASNGSLIWVSQLGDPIRVSKLSSATFFETKHDARWQADKWNRSSIWDVTFKPHAVRVELEP